MFEPLKFYCIQKCSTFPDSVSGDGLRQRKPQEEEDIDLILQHHRQMHEKLAEELLHHTHNLKDFAYNSSAIVKKDIEVWLSY